jgi:hypothetical protein
MPEVGGELRQKGEMPLLSSGPRRRGSLHGRNQRFMVGDEAEFPAFEQEPEMSDSTVCGKQFAVKSRVPRLGWR